MKKEITLGTMDYYGKRKSVIIEFELQTKTKENKRNFKTLKKVKGEYYTFSASGQIGRGNSCDCAGQILGDIKKNLLEGKINLEDKKKLPLYLELIDIWEKYHLNDFRTGTYKQELIVKEIKSYDKARATLILADMLEDGMFEYGTEWLLELIPKNVISRIKKLEKIL